MEFEGWMNAEVRRQEKINMAEERDFRRGELSEKYMAKLLYGITNKILTGCDTGAESVLGVQYKDMIIDR